MRQVKCDSTKHANRATNKKQRIFCTCFIQLSVLNFFHVFSTNDLSLSSIAPQLPSYIFIDILLPLPFHLHDTHFSFIFFFLSFIIALNEATTKVISNFSLNAFYADIFLYFAAAVIFFSFFLFVCCCFSSFESVMNA